MPTQQSDSPHVSLRRAYIRRPPVRHLAAIQRSGGQRSDVDDIATWQPSHGQVDRDPTPRTWRLGSHPTVRLTEIQRPELGDLAAIPRSGCKRSDAHDVATWQPSHGRSVGRKSDAHDSATWQPSHGKAAKDPTLRTLPLGSHPTVRLPGIRR
jgi:hypothetical protein